MVLCRQISNNYLFPHKELTGPVADHMTKRKFTSDSPQELKPSQKRANMQQV